MNKTVLITGASGGIGYELARLFAKDGYDLILTARSEQKLADVKNEIISNYSVSIDYIPLDLSDYDSADTLYTAVKNTGKNIDVLVNNAGFGDKCDFVKSDWSRQQSMMNLNILALVRLSHLIGRDMADKGNGKILNISSIASFLAGPYMAIYYATKAFVSSFSLALSEELARYGVTVTAMCPGPTSTNFEKEANLEDSKMFKSLKVATAKDVAKSAYKVMNKGKPLTYYGLSSKLLNIIVRLSPKKTCSKFSKKINGIPNK